MSTIDNRIVRMQFDNEQFERGVMQSMRTLDELNEKLQFKEAGKGISALQVHLNNVDFSGIQNAVQHINHSFTSMTGMVAQRIKEDIVDNVINAAKRLEQVTLGQIKSGGKARAQNIANAKFMIEGLKYDWEAVNKAADYAVTDTAYGLDAAVKAASQLAASGVDFQETIETVNGTDLTQMHKSLRAISGVAAMTNASYDEIAHIFTSVAGMGKLTAMQMNQLSLRGLNIASTIAEQTGKTEQEIREMVSKSQISFQMFADAMDSAYGDHAKDANKTFAGSLSNLKAALSRIGAIFQQPVIDKTNTFFVSVTGKIKEFQKALNDEKSYRVTEKGMARITKEANAEAKALGKVGKAYADSVKQIIETKKKELLENKEALKTKDVEEFTIARFATHFAEAWESAIQFVSKVTDSLDVSWFKSIGTFLDNAAQKVTKFFNAASTAIDKVKKSVDDTSNSIADSLELDMEDLNLLHRILKNEFGYVEERWAKLDEIYKKQGSTKTGKWLQGYMDQLAGVGYSFEALGWTEEEFKKKQEELAKSEAERVQGMTKEELLVQNLGYVYNNLKHVMDGVKTTVGNVVKSLWNAATAIWKVLTYVDQIGESFQLYTVTDGIAKVSAALFNLSEALQPSTEKLQDMGDALSIAAQYLTSFVNFIFDTTAAFIDFVAACLKADESLDDLAKNESLTSMQRAVLDVMRVVNNLRRLLAALGKIAIKIFKSIKTAFMNVFGGQELGGALTAVTGGFTLLTDGIATAAEKVAESEAPFKVIETLFGTIFLIVRKVSDLLGKFTTGIRKFKNGTEDTIDVANDAIKVGEKGSSIVEGLGSTFAKGVKWITELPSKLKTLWETVKKQEGVVHLKESVENLWKTMKDAVTKGMDPMTKSMNEVSRVTGGEGETSLGALADGIGKVADKIAGFLDKLPEYGAKIKKFFEDTKAWFDKTIADLHLDELGEGISTAFSDIFSTDDSLFNKVKKFAEQIFLSVVEGLAGVNWKEVGKGGILTLVGANLFNFFKITGDIEGMLKGIRDIPAQIGKILSGLSKVLTTADKSLNKVTNTYIFVAVVKAIVSLAAAVAMLAMIPKDDLNKALAAIFVLGLIAYGILAGVALVTHLLNSDGPKQVSVMEHSNNVLSQINLQLGKFVGLALVIASFGASVMMIAKAVKVLVDASKEHGTPGIVSAAIKKIGEIAAAVGIIAGVIYLITAIPFHKDAFKKLTGMSALILALSASLYFISSFLVDLSSNDFSAGAFGALVTFMALLMAGVSLMVKAASGTDWKSLLLMTFLVGAVAGTLAVICIELNLLAMSIKALSIGDGGRSVILAISAISAILLSMGIMMFLMGSAFSKTENDATFARNRGPALIGALLSIAAVVFVLGKTVKSMTESFQADNKGFALAVGTILLTLSLVALIVSKLVKGVTVKGSGVSDAVLGLAAAFAAIGVCMFLIGEAVKLMGATDGTGAMIVAIGMLGLITVALISLMAAAKKLGGDKVTEVLQNIAIAFVAIGASLLLMAIAAQTMSGVEGVFTNLMITMGVLLGAFIALGILMSVKDGAFAGGFEKATNVFKGFAVAALLLSVAVMALGLGLGLVATGFGKLAIGISLLATAMAEHKVTTVLTIILIAALVVVLYKLFSVVEAVLPAVTSVVTAVSSAIHKLIETVSGKLKKGGDGIIKWWQKLQPNLKIMIVSGIATLCAAIIKASPQLLNTVKVLLGKLIGFLIDVIPMLVDGLLDILIKLINSLADSIRSHAAQIAYAFWNLLESLVEVLMQVLSQLVTLIVGDGKIGKTVSGLIEAGTGRMRSHLAEMKQNADAYEDNVTKWADAWTMLEHTTDDNSDYAKARKELDNLENKLDEGTDKVNNLTDAFEGNKKGFTDMVRVQGIPIEIPATAVKDGKVFGGDLSNSIQTGLEDNPINLDPNAIMNGDEMYNIGSDGGEQLIAGCGESIEEGHTEVYDATYDTVQEGPIDAIQDSEGSVRKAVEEHIQKPVLDMVGDDGYRKQLYTRGYSNAGYILRGLKEGMEAQMDMVGNVSFKTAETINDDFIGPMQIMSPSKLFYEHGAYILQGLANGMEANMDLAAGATSDMSDTIVNSFAAPLDYISKMASGEIQYDPTIRPVLDSSNIGRGAGAINSMFRNQNVSLSGFSGQLAADIGQLDSRNSDVVSELRALREEMAIMGEEISNMQVVMDTGALVGATAGPMDKALGQRAVRFGRGN